MERDHDKGTAASALDFGDTAPRGKRSAGGSGLGSANGRGDQ